MLALLISLFLFQRKVFEDSSVTNDQDYNIPSEGRVTISEAQTYPKEDGSSIISTCVFYDIHADSSGGSPVTLNQLDYETFTITNTIFTLCSGGRSSSIYSKEITSTLTINKVCIHQCDPSSSGYLLNIATHENVENGDEKVKIEEFTVAECTSSGNDFIYIGRSDSGSDYIRTLLSHANFTSIQNPSQIIQIQKSVLTIELSTFEVLHVKQRIFY